MVESKEDSRSHRGSERRQHTRHPIDLSAKMQLGDGPAVSVAMRDFSTGGMLLVSSHAEGAACISMGKISPGEVIRLSCHLPGNLSADLHLQAKVVRRTDSSIGVSFIEPELAVLVQLENYAREQAARIARGEKLDSHFADQPLIRRCRDVVTGSITPVLDGFFSAIAEHLFQSCENIKDIRLQNAYFKAMGILNNQKDQIQSTFASSLTTAMQRELEQHIDVELSALDVSADSLSLIEDSEFDDLLATTGVVDSVYNQNREEMDDLHTRLGEALGRKVDKNTNPFGAAVYAEGLQKSLRVLDIEHGVLMVCYKVFGDVLARQLGDVISRMNALLIEAGILPEIEHKLVKTPEPDQKSPVAEAEAEQQAVPGAEEDEASQGGQVDADTAMQDLKDLAAERSAGGTAAPRADGEIASRAGGGSENPRQIISPAEALDLYDLVQDLRQLRSSVKQGESVAGQQAGEGSTEAGKVVEHPAVQSFKSADVINALTALESRSVERGDGKTIKERVIDALRKTSGNEDMVIAEHDDKVMDVTVDVFDEMKDDLQVAAALKTWLEKLEIPIMKIALTDDTIFTDRKHIARDVINNIARLELSGGDSQNSVQSSIKQSLNWLVGLMNKEFDGSPDVFKRVNDQLDLLLKVQEKEYDKNVERVAELSATNKALNEEDEAVKLMSAEFAARDDERKELLNRVHRLQEGDWVVFGVDTDDPSRLRVAWVATHTEKLVFVNLLGEKDRTISMVELAEQLLEKSAIILDNVDDPIMDRAQYSMLQDLHQKLLHETTHDQLTGLLNRREFEKQVNEAVYEAHNDNKRHALLHLDFDQFNVINNSHGYEAGDYVLEEMSKLLTQENDCDKVIGRIGSDEFAVLLWSCPMEDAMEASYELLQQINDKNLAWDDKKLAVSVSIGLVPINKKSETGSNLLQEAESSCRVAKDLGGNRVQMYQPDHAKLSQRKESVKWAAKVEEVIDKGGFSLRCQRIAPVQNIETEHAHYEILLNVHDSDGSELPLDEFIKAAEHYNKMPVVDRWVISSMFNWIADNIVSLGDIEKFSINLSGRSINDEDFLEYILEEIYKSGVPTEIICFEITETAGIANLSTATEFINAIKETGCRFSLDDFGSGQSSYGYLKNLPVDYVKIDGVFVKDMVNTPSDYAVVKSITEIAHFMGKFVIAEYVENNEIIEKLAEIGVDYAQGYGVEKPIQIDELLN